jgi:hypothetical protein
VTETLGLEEAEGEDVGEVGVDLRTPAGWNRPWPVAVMCRSRLVATLFDMKCAHCKRELAGVAAIFPGTPAVCCRADCLAWARALVPLPTPPSASKAA